MFWQRLPQAVCVLSVCACLAFTDDDEIDGLDSYYEVDTYYNEIPDGDAPEPTPSQAPCSSPDLTKWDKLFSMLENSQMRENMLLQFADDIMKGEVESIRSEMLRFVAKYGGSCGVAVETTGRKMVLQLEARLREALDRFRPQGDPTWNSAGIHLEATLQQLLSAAQTQASRLAKLETSCFSGPADGIVHSKTGFRLPRGHQKQEAASQEMALEAALVALQQTKVGLEEVLRSSKQRSLPAGCEMALLFPMRSSRIYTSVIPDVPLSLTSFTVCMWVKPTVVSNKTVLFSYGNRRNPYEIQLLLGQTSALFTIGGEAHLVEARNVVNPRGPSKWIHLCGAWNSEHGLASLWAGGKQVAITPGVAEGHIIPDGGSLQLGQERNDSSLQSPSSGRGMPGFEASFDHKLAFAGKMTGVNMWDRVLSEDEMSQLALQDGQGCEQRGNVVAWGVTEMLPHGGAQFIN